MNVVDRCGGARYSTTLLMMLLLLIHIMDGPMQCNAMREEAGDQGKDGMRRTLIRSRGEEGEEEDDD